MQWVTTGGGSGGATTSSTQQDVGIRTLEGSREELGIEGHES